MWNKYEFQDMRAFCHFFLLIESISISRHLYLNFTNSVERMSLEVPGNFVALNKDLVALNIKGFLLSILDIHGEFRFIEFIFIFMPRYSKSQEYHRSVKIERVLEIDWSDVCLTSIKQTSEQTNKQLCLAERSWFDLIPLFMWETISLVIAFLFHIFFFTFRFFSYSFSFENEDVKEKNSCGESLDI